ncbi:MAG: TetR/AcrR family transcriptional regulator [Desulfobacterales bacterium]|nr:TetR/AcrR family transcriptional regulator [Desulfobacterales bacterium]
MPKIVDHDQIRKKLLESCFSLFSQKGYSKTSVREIAKQAGTSTGTLYHYFKNKEDILEQLLVYIRKKNFSRYLEMIEGIESAEKRLELITGFWKAHIEEYQHLILLAVDYMRTGPGEEKTHGFHDFTEFYVHALSRTLKIPARTAQMLVTYLTGLVLTSLLVPGRTEEQINDLRDLLRLQQGRTETTGLKKQTATGKEETR